MSLLVHGRGALPHLPFPKRKYGRTDWSNSIFAPLSWVRMARMRLFTSASGAADAVAPESIMPRWGSEGAVVLDGCHLQSTQLETTKEEIRGACFHSAFLGIALRLPLSLGPHSMSLHPGAFLALSFGLALALVSSSIWTRTISSQSACVAL